MFSGIRDLHRRLAIWAALLPCLAGAADFFVAPEGQDGNPGTAAEPFASPARAQQAARRVAGREAVTVWLRAGTYPLAQPLVFEASDSGAPGRVVTYRAEGDGPVILSGGITVATRWVPHTNGVWVTAVPADVSGDQLFVDGQRQILARYPNFDAGQRIFNGFDPEAFAPSRARNWADPRGGFIHAMHKHEWGDFHYVITGRDAEGQVTYEGGWQNNRRYGMHPKHRFVENIREELDAPGEWFLDSAASRLFFLPPPGLDLARARVELVRLRQLVEFRGTSNAPVHHVALRGLTFRHAARTFMDNREPLLRSDWTTHRGGAIHFAGAEDCSLDDCFVDQVGGNAVFVDGYNRRLAFRACRIWRAGGNGFAFVGQPKAVRSPLFEYSERQPLDRIDRQPGPRSPDYPSDCLVEDCLVHETGRVEKQTAPVQIAMAARITVRHCSLYDVPRAGINIGDGCWGGHVIEHNDVFDTVKETGDHGSFNSWGRDRYWLPDIKEVDRLVAAHPDLPGLDAVEPVILRHNRWRCDHGWDIDLDDGSSNYRIEDNLCLNGGLKLREGFRRTVSNNVILNNSFHPHVWFADSGDVFQRNIVMTWYKPIGMPPRWGREIDSNLLPDEPALARSRSLGLDSHSLAGDPRFQNPAHGDFRVAEDSPALSVSFRNFAMDAFGVRPAALRAMARTPVIPRLAPRASASAAASEPAGSVVPWLGARWKKVTEPGEVSAAGLPGPVGILLVDRPADSAAARAGFQPMDVLLDWQGETLRAPDELARRHRALPSGQTALLRIFRQQKETTLGLSARPAE